VEGQADAEGGALARLAGDVHRPAVGADDPGDEAEAEIESFFGRLQYTGLASRFAKGTVSEVGASIPQPRKKRGWRPPRSCVRGGRSSNWCEGLLSTTIGKWCTAGQDQHRHSWSGASAGQFPVTESAATLSRYQQWALCEIS
jgi:hypothetical protein